MVKLIEPTYDISTTPEGVHQISVDTKIDIRLLKRNKKLCGALFNQEAKKNSLFAMALIHKLADDNVVTAVGLRTLYQSYHKFFDHPDKSQLIDCCHRVMGDENAGVLPRNCAKYLLAILHPTSAVRKGKAIHNFELEDLSAARAFLNRLIPSIEETLTMKLPKIIYNEQEVTIAEMEASHNAFPDLIKHKGHYYVCFREGSSHVLYNDFGKIRVLRGDFNETTKKWKWKQETLLSKEGFDLRDPRFFVTDKQELHMIIGGSIIDEKDETVRMVPHVARKENGQWSLFEADADPSADGPNGQWIWRVTWNPFDKHGYAFSYGKGSVLSLMKSSDGIRFEKIADVGCAPITELSEGTLRFQSDGKAIALIRSRRNGLIGTSLPSDGYSNWSLNIVPFRIGGPDFQIEESALQGCHERGKMWVASRHFFLNEDNTLDEATIVGCMNEKTIVPLIRLRSYLDNSYPGMVLEDDGTATIIHYSSSSESISKIYVTRVKLRGS